METITKEDIMNTQLVKYKHSGNSGDLIYALGIMSRATPLNAKAIIYIKLNQPSGFTDKTHPIGSVMMNQYMYDMLRPLLLSQSWIVDVQVHEGQEVDYDLDLFRTECKNLSAGDIKKWYDIAFPFIPTEQPRNPFVLPVIKNDYIIVNRTSRYNNMFVDYSRLWNLDNVKFVGTDKEFESIALHNDRIEHLKVSDFKELALIIAGCRMFIGNQSMAFAIAEMLQANRMLEQYIHAPNVIPDGGKYYVFQTNEQFLRILAHEFAEYKDKDWSKAFKSEGATAPSEG